MNLFWQRNLERFSEILRTNREVFVMKIKTRIQYFSDNSSLKSVGYVISLARTSLFKRLFWLVTLSACCFGFATVLRGALRLYTQDAVSYSVETDYLNWDTHFPAVSICEQLNNVKIKNIIEKQYNNNTSLNEFLKQVAFWNKEYCKVCSTCKVNVSCVEDFVPIVDQVRSTCEEVMGECSFNGVDFPCCERFKPVATEYGVCYVFNSHEKGDVLEHVNRIIGLPTLTLTTNIKSYVKVHSPEERISVVTENILGLHCYKLVGGVNIEINVAAEEVVNDASVRSIAPRSRDCLFEDEVPAELEGWPFEEYSYSGCVWYCRARAQAAACNCTTHFMPRIGTIPVCNLQGLKCLYTKSKKSIETDKACKCPMSCYEVTYNPVRVKCPQRDDSQEMKAQVKIGQLPHLRVRRQAIRDMLGLVVDVGGVVGVFFGASLLSFIEITYIFCMRKYNYQ